MAVREGVKEATDGVSKRALRGVDVVPRLFAVGVNGGATAIEGTGVCRGAEKDGFVDGRAGLPFVASGTAPIVEENCLGCSEAEIEATLCDRNLST